MCALGLVKPGTPLPEAADVPVLKVRLDDTLAAGDRLWVRGRLVGVSAPSENGRRWWKPWGRSGEPDSGPPPVQLQTRISGHLLDAKPDLSADGHFEATFSAHLPEARRGWRMARNRVTVAGQHADACNVVLTPPADAKVAVVVALPAEITLSPDGPRRLAASRQAAKVTELLRGLHQPPGANNPVYYVACVPPEETHRQAEMALAISSLGWPAGYCLLLPTDRAGAAAALAHAVDRLRWLFFDALELAVLNLEPAAARPLEAFREPAPDRADLCQLVQPGGETCTPLNGKPSRPLSGLRPLRGALVPRHPVVFCHGMLAFSFLRMQIPEDTNCFSPLREFFRDRGIRAFFPQVPPTSGVAERAARLRDELTAWTDGPVNLVAHSFGGLDARYLITHLGMADRVRSLTTICTPHRGTYVADWFCANFRQRVPLLLALEAMGFNMDGFRDCRPEVCAAFNERTPDSPLVRYFSYGGEVGPQRLTPMLRRSWNLLTPVEGPNDGLVSVASARWGEYLGTIQADHFAQTPDAVFLRQGEDFDSLTFYSSLVENLARRGF